LLSYNTLNAQSGYFSAGYGAHFFENPEFIKLLELHNELNPNGEFNIPTFMDGIDLHFGYGDFIFFDVGFSGRYSNINAFYIDSSDTKNRGVKHLYNIFNATIGINLPSQSTGANFGIGLGQLACFDKVKIDHDLSDGKFINQYNVEQKNFVPGFEFFIQLILHYDFGSFLIRPSYKYLYSTISYEEAFNSLNIPVINTINLSGRSKGFGLSLQLISDY